MLMTVQALTPKLRWIEFQHCRAVAAMSLSFIQRSSTTASLAWRTRDGAGTLLVLVYALIWSSLAVTLASSSGSRPIQPNTSDRSTVKTLIPDASSNFSENRTVLKALG